MSDITNTILTFSSAEYEETRIKEVNQLLDSVMEAKGNKYQKFNPIGDNSGGYKGLECVLYACAFNHFNADDLVPLLYNINWSYPNEVQVLIKQSDHEKFHIYILDSDSYKRIYEARNEVPFIG